MITLTTNGKTTRTYFKSLTSVKRWATKYHHAWEVRDGAVVVSAADGTILVYRDVPTPPAKERPPMSHANPANLQDVWVSVPSARWSLGMVIEVRRRNAEGPTLGYFRVEGWQEDGTARLSFHQERPEPLGVN